MKKSDVLEMLKDFSDDDELMLGESVYAYELKPMKAVRNSL